MSEQAPAPAAAAEGQAIQGSQGTETTPAAPAPAADGQASSAQGTSPAAPTGQETETSFFDQSEIPEGLEGAYKNMQGSFTRKMQSLSEAQKAHAQKVEAYDAFTANPIEAMQQMATRYGLTISRAEAAAAVQQQATGQPASGFTGEEGNPASWDEVRSVIANQTRQEIMQALQPYLSQIQTQSASNIEKEFDQLDTSSGLPAGAWREHDGKMQDLLNKHPTLANDPATLYRMSIPEEVQQSKAMQKALAKLDQKAKNAQIGGESSVGNIASTEGASVKSFADAVSTAKAKLAAGGG